MVHRIDAADPYPRAYDETVARKRPGGLDTAACRGDTVGEGLAVQASRSGTQGQQLSIRG